LFNVIHEIADALASLLNVTVFLEHNLDVLCLEPPQGAGRVAKVYLQDVGEFHEDL
jgi:hypothetical protein